MPVSSNFFSRFFHKKPHRNLDAGLLLGRHPIRQKPLLLDNWAATKNVLILGQAGSGKTTFARALLEQQTLRGGGWLCIDPHPTQETRDLLARQVGQAGREKDFYVLDIANPENSNTYNPVFSGDADTIAQRLLSLLPGTDNDPGADFYKQSAARALTVIIAALQAAKKLFTLSDLSDLLTSAPALYKLEYLIRGQGREAVDLADYLAEFSTKTKFQTKIDPYKLKSMLGGMAGRIAQFSQGKYGEVLNNAVPEIDFADILTNNKMCYVMLPSLEKGNSALQLGRMLLSDFRSTAAALQNNESLKRDIPFVLFADQLSSYWTNETAYLLRQSRHLNLSVITALQSLDELQALAQVDRTCLLENAYTKVLLPSHRCAKLETLLDGCAMLDQPYREILQQDLQRLRTGHALMLSGAKGVRVKLAEPTCFNASTFALKRLGKGKDAPWGFTVWQLPVKAGYASVDDLTSHADIL